MEEEQETVQNISKATWMVKELTLGPITCPSKKKKKEIYTYGIVILTPLFFVFKKPQVIGTRVSSWSCREYRKIFYKRYYTLSKDFKIRNSKTSKQPPLQNSV